MTSRNVFFHLQDSILRTEAKLFLIGDTSLWADETLLVVRLLAVLA